MAQLQALSRRRGILLNLYSDLMFELHRPEDRPSNTHEMFASNPQFRRVPAPSRQTNRALRGIILCLPVAFAAFLFAGFSMGSALFLALGLQIALFCAVLFIGLVQASPTLEYRATTAHFDDQATETADTWLTYSANVETENPTRIALIAPSGLQSRSIAADLVSFGHEVHHCTDFDAMIASVQARPSDWDLVIFDTDTAPGVDSVEEDLLQFRTLCPQMPVMLVSSRARCDEIGNARNAVCDVNLRKPVYRSTLRDSISMAGLTEFIPNIDGLADGLSF